MQRSARGVINIQSLQGACWLDRAADSAVLYGTLRETMEINSHYKSHIVLSPFTEIDDQMGTNSPLYGGQMQTEYLRLFFIT